MITRMELLLRGEVEMQRLDLLLKRAELGNQELLPLQNELRQTKAARDGSEEMLRVNEQQLSDFTAMVEKRAHAASEEESQGLEQQVHSLEQRIRNSKTRLQAQRARIDHGRARLYNSAAAAAYHELEPWDNAPILPFDWTLAKPSGGPREDLRP